MECEGEDRESGEEKTGEWKGEIQKGSWFSVAVSNKILEGTAG
jgi:hypothetical protein